MSVSDSHIEDIANGDTKSFERLYDFVSPSIIVLARQIVENRDDAEDVVHEVFVAYWKSREDFSKLDNVKAYLYVTTKNLCFNFLRSKKIHNRFVDKVQEKGDNFFRSLIIEEETYSIVSTAVKELPPQTQRIIKMSIQGANNKDIAENLGVSINTVETLKLKGYKSLRSKLKDHIYIIMIIGEILLN